MNSNEGKSREGAKVCAVKISKGFLHLFAAHFAEWKRCLPKTDWEGESCAAQEDADALSIPSAGSDFWAALENVHGSHIPQSVCTYIHYVYVHKPLCMYCTYMQTQSKGAKLTYCAVCSITTLSLLTSLRGVLRNRRKTNSQIMIVPLLLFLPTAAKRLISFGRRRRRDGFLLLLYTVLDLLPSFSFSAKNNWCFFRRKSSLPSPFPRSALPYTLSPWHSVLLYLLLTIGAVRVAVITIVLLIVLRNWLIVE